MARSSEAVAWSQPQMCNVPWVTSRRSSSAGDQRTSPVCPPRPASACSIGPLDRDDDVAEVDAAAGRSRDVECLPAWDEGRWRQQRERQHVRRAGVAHMGDVEVGRSRRRRRGSTRSMPARALARRRGLCRSLRRGWRSTRAIRPRPAGRRRSATAVDRWLGSRLVPGHELDRSPPPAACARRDSSSTTVFCG